ncbi:MAG: hypothetical protein AVDCRST_MAG58-3603, partial [uncultured Rubrobacteraceae bacterium]
CSKRPKERSGWTITRSGSGAPGTATSRCASRCPLLVGVIPNPG